MKKENNKIVDFGEKIGGAKKDLWVNDLPNLDEMTIGESIKYVTKNNIFPFNAKSLMENGADKWITYWQQKMRMCIKKEPIFTGTMTEDEVKKECEKYIEIVLKYKDVIMSVTSDADMKQFYIDVRSCNFPTTIYFDKRKMSNYYYNHEWYKRDCMRSSFPNKNTFNTSKKRKVKFIPPQLDHIDREGEVYRVSNINADIWQNTFNFRGVEFGNWETQNDRQWGMNYAYDALKDLAITLKIDDKDIAFSGDLALAFGARGNNSATAHYEPERRVINLTKIRGAGSTAHEWGHALDHQINLFYGGNGIKLASEDINNNMPKSFRSLINSMKYCSDGYTTTDFYKGSQRFNQVYTRDSQGYWQSNAEMFARAFACYVSDTYGMKSDYLFAHADTYVFKTDDESFSAIPQGEEREILDELFDRLFYDLKKDGMFHKRVPKEKITVPKKSSIITDLSAIIREDISTGQLSFIV